MENPNLDYDVITNDALDEFTDSVNNALSNGWLLYGNIVVTGYSEKDEKGEARIYETYTQSLVKPRIKKKKL